jgi:site-specific DNA-methyltransferase (adenine-specific)
MIQKSLFESQGKQTVLLPEVPLSAISISKFNPRRTWEEKHVASIAQYIERNGYDGTKAIKCHLENGVYMVFAGSNRLKAMQKLGRESIPVFLYSGYTDEEIWRMAYEDNEQADAQAQFSIVDIWMDYKAKSEAGWTQQKIADVLGVSQSTVKFRLQYAGLGEKVLTKISTNQFVKEGHCRELLELVQCTIFPYESLLIEIIENVLARTKEPTSNQFKSEVEKYNQAIKAAEHWAQQLEDDYLNNFLQSIQDKRSEAGINAQGRKYFEEQAEAAKQVVQDRINQLTKDEQKAKQDLEKAAREKKLQEVLDRIVCMDSRQAIANYPNGIKLLFTDPPYGKDFQSNRRTASAKADKISNDKNIGEAIDLTSDILRQIFPKMADNSAVLMWCDWLYEPDFRKAITDTGFVLKNSIVWVKSNHGTGDLDGSFAPKHERLIFAVKGRPTFNDNGRLPDVLNGNEFLQTEHPTPKPIDLMERLIRHLTNEGDIVVDTFSGIGSTAVATIKSGCIYYGSEIDAKWNDEAHNHVNKILTA